MQSVLFNKNLINYIAQYMNDVDDFNNLYASCKTIGAKLRTRWITLNHASLGAYNKYTQTVLSLPTINWTDLYGNILCRDNLRAFIAVLHARKDKTKSANPVIIHDELDIHSIFALIMNSPAKPPIGCRVETNCEEIVCRSFIPQRIYAYIAVRNPKMVAQSDLIYLIAANKPKLLLYLLKHICPRLFLRKKILASIAMNGYTELVTHMYKSFGKPAIILTAWNADTINATAKNGHKALAKWLLKRKFGPYQQYKEILNNIY